MLISFMSLVSVVLAAQFFLNVICPFKCRLPVAGTTGASAGVSRSGEGAEGSTCRAHWRKPWANQSTANSKHAQALCPTACRGNEVQLSSERPAVSRNSVVTEVLNTVGSDSIHPTTVYRSRCRYLALRVFVISFLKAFQNELLQPCLLLT